MDEQKVRIHKEIIDSMHDLYERKNKDYGDSVHDTYEKYGMTSFLVRMEDKLNRVRTLTSDDTIALVSDEKIEDTLLDLANYAVLAIIELRRDKIYTSECISLGDEKQASEQL